MYFSEAIYGYQVFIYMTVYLTHFKVFQSCRHFGKLLNFLVVLRGSYVITVNFKVTGSNSKMNTLRLTQRCLKITDIKNKKTKTKFPSLILILNYFSSGFVLSDLASNATELAVISTHVFT